MSRLKPSLEQSLKRWHAELALAREHKLSAAQTEAVAMREVTVIVTFDGTVEPLRAAGLRSGYHSGNVVHGIIAYANLEQLDAVPSVVSIAKEPTFKTLLDNTVKEMKVPWKVPPTDPWPGKGAGVIVAIIDTGIDIFHDSFRKNDGKTRILELWDQSATTGGSAPPAAFTQLGRVYSEQNINDAITAGPPFASVDKNGHGTHVAGIAAGNGRQDDRCSFPGRYVGVAPEADLVIVKAIDIPSATIGDALQWCAQAKMRLPGNKPVVINCSFGSDTGPHDGTSASDGEVDRVVRPAGGPPAGLAIVIAAGNASRDDIHESGTVNPGATATVSFEIPNGSQAGDVMDIWYNGTASLTIEIIAPPNPSLPGPVTTGPIPPGAAGSPFTIGKMTLTVSSSTAPLATHNNKKEISIGIATPPTLSVRPGTWQIKLTAAPGAAANWDAWFESSHTDPYPTFRLPNESGDPVPRRRANTLDEPGTSKNAITVAAYDDSNGHLANFSSQGPANQAGVPSGEFKPTVSAPGVGVSAPRSQNDPDSNSSCCDQKVIDKDGTSMASPHVTGLVALMLQKNGALTFEQIRGHLQHSARIDGIPAAEVPPVIDPMAGIRGNLMWGAGKVDASVALAEMPAAGGGGGGGGMPMSMTDLGLGYTPHNLVSRLGEWQNRFGPRAGLMLFASLVSEHVDEVLRLINHNRKVATVWRRHGGPLLVRRLLHGAPPNDSLLPATIDNCDMSTLLSCFLPTLARFGGARLKADIARFGDFITRLPGAKLTDLDKAALTFSVHA